MALLVNQLAAAELRLFTPETGVWFADADVVLDDTGIVPTGPAVLTLGTALYRGMIDPRGSGAFAKLAKLRIVGGMGGWDKSVLPFHFHNPAGLLSTAVYTATAAAVLETVVDVTPRPLGQDFVRVGGRASSVFDGVDWYVTPEGITTVGPRLPIPFDPTSVDILSYDPLMRTAELASDAPIVPGTILLDPTRFDGPLVVRDVEQTWGAKGARATVWCAEKKGSRLQTALTALVGAKIGLPYLKTYRYRVVLQDALTKALTLQIIEPADGVPNAIPFDMWMGVPGVSAKVLLGSEVLVQFVAGDPPQPVVVAFKKGQLPPEINIGAALSPIALATATQTQIAAIQTELGAVATAMTKLGLVTPSAATECNAAATAIGTGATAVAGEVLAATSIRVKSD